ncbi:MAG: threonine/serine dehydratase [Gaiellaceae bacterium]
MITVDDVRAARETIGDDLHRTPVFSSRTLGANVFLKAELFQRTGSFKPRGVLNKLRSLSEEERARGVIGVSAGNHAQALAYGAAVEGIDALLVMWLTASAAKIDATRGYGAEVDLEAEGPETVFDRLEELVAETGRTLVHPFDDPLVAAGQGTVGLELAEQVEDVDTVVVPVGGGGLISGIAAALPDKRVIGVEPVGSNALTLGLAQNEPVRLSPRSIADGLNAPFAGALAIELARRHEVQLVLVEEDEIENAFRFLYQRAKLACEPAAAASVAAILSGKIPLAKDETVVAVVSGGNVSGETAGAILA